MFLFALLTGLLVAPDLKAQSPFVGHVDALQTRVAETFDGFVGAETETALEAIRNNIGSDGSSVSGAASGLVIASPSKLNPDYFYTWTRDAALTMKALLDIYIFGDGSLEGEMEDYVFAQARLQAVPNPSGDLSDGSGLGEPKFEADGSAFQGAWGRPQRDGPALRATTLIAYSRHLIANGSDGDPTFVETTLWPIIINDLNYVAQYWNNTGFDFWEEINGSSFFTTAVQYRSLIDGADLAGQIGQSCDLCVSQAPQILCFLQDYWNGEYIEANINVNSARSSQDINSILGSIHTFDPSAGCNEATFQPCSAKALANHKVVVDAFRSLYDINGGIAIGSAVAVGRYPEDVYMGGNPWYLATAAAAEQMYEALYQWKRLGQLEVTETSLQFFRDFNSDVAAAIYTNGTETFASLIGGISAYADGFLEIVQKFTPEDGSLAEQFSRDDGAPLSAENLTWSYASLLTAVARRNGQVPASWGAPSANTIPSTCSANPAEGTYTTPTATAPLPPCATVTSVAVTFNVQEATVPGEDVFISGSIPEFGGWDADGAAVPLSANAYQASYPRWWVEVEVPGGVAFEYKYLKKEADGRVVFEIGRNRQYTVPSGCAEEVSVYDTWHG